MRLLPALFLSMLSIKALAADRSYIQEYYAAKELEAKDPKEAAEGMKRSFHLAVEDGNGDYATSAGLNGAYMLYRRDQEVEAGRLCRETLKALESLNYSPPDGDVERRVQLFGLMERGLLQEGKIGEAWKANRAAAETLRGKRLRADDDGRAISVEDLKLLSPGLRSYGWRLIEREADMLDYVGRSLDARALLDKSAEKLGKEWNAIPVAERFYAFKLLSSRCELLDYIGYEKDAIDTQKVLIESYRRVSQPNPSFLTLQINLLRNLSQWDGPSEQLLEEARGIGEKFKSFNAEGSANRLLAKMELDLRDSKEAIEALKADAKKQAGLGRFLDGAYADRDSLISRSRAGEQDLDQEFAALLVKMRSQGNKRGEPNLYKEYGGYLLERNRPGEAISMFEEALRLKRSFGLILHEPGLLSSLFHARLGAGDVSGAKATLVELESLLKRHANEFPASRRAYAETIRANALWALGDKAGSKAALELARQFAADLPEYRRLWLQLDKEDRSFDPETASPAVQRETATLRIQPLEIVSVVSPKQIARTRFVVSNPGSQSISGEWVISGPGASSDASGSVQFTAGKAAATLALPLAVSGGGEASLKVALGATEGVDAAKVQVGWRPREGEASKPSTWEVQWQADAVGRVVLDASLIEANPFRSISLFHELAVPVGETVGIPFRMRSPVPLRLEYYDPTTGEILAIDADGNGDFTNTGDLHSKAASGIACALVPVKSPTATLTVEVRIFAPGGAPLAITPAIVLESEVHRNGAWTKEAESTLK